MSTVSHNLDRLHVVFDEPNLVANAGLVAVATLTSRLGLEELINESVKLGGRAGAANAGEKLLTLVHALVAGGSHIDHVDMLRSGGSGTVLSHRVVAPSTLGTFLRSFDIGNDRQLDSVLGESLKRAWSLGAGPGDDRLILDLDSTICEVFGDQKQGVAYGYTRQKGYHPLIASRADTGEILHARLRKGSSQSGADRFAAELIGRVRRAGATGEIHLRADAGFWSRKLIDTLERNDVSYSITVKMNPRIAAAIASIPEEAWTPIGLSDGEEAEVAEVAYVSTGRNGEGRGDKTFRLIVRRTRRIDGTQATLFPQWRYHAHVTNRDEPAVMVEREHRQHATVELAIRDLKEGAGLSHLPSGDFWANAAWLTAVALAHNLIRWTTHLGEPHHRGKLTVAATFRTRLIALPARLVNRAGRPTLRLPQGWPWAERLQGLLTRLRHLPQPA